MAVSPAKLGGYYLYLQINVLFFDYGIGTINLDVCIPCEDSGEIPYFLRKSKEFIRWAIDLIFDFQVVDEEMRALEHKLKEALPPDPVERLFDQSVRWRRTSDFGECVVLTAHSTEHHGTFPLNSAQTNTLTSAMCSYCGDISQAEFGWSERTQGVLDFNVGLSSSALILTEDDPAVRFDLSQALTFSTMNLALLSDIISEFRGVARTLAFDEMANSIAESRPDEFERVLEILDAVYYDMLPSNYVANAYEGLLFGRMWEGWHGSDLWNSLCLVMGSYQRSVERIKGQASRKLGENISIIVFIFTILSMGSLVSAIINLYDINDKVFGPGIFGCDQHFWLRLICRHADC